MTYLAAGLVASGIAWLGNSIIVGKWGDRGVIWVVPVFEEIIKTASALVIGAAVPLTHGVFGLVEAFHDYMISRHPGVWAGLVSLISHWLFGQATYFVFRITDLWVIGIIAAALLHIYINLLMVRLFAYLSRS